MRGAVAAGHPLTAQAGADVLAQGGNAVDACIAAAFVSWVTESPATGPGGGGFMLVHRARDRSDRLLDFFVAVPGRGGPPAGTTMDAIDVEFAPGSLQRFSVGPASCGVPGTIAGLAETHRLYGRLPWAELVVPAAALARGGVELSPEQARLTTVLAPILRLDAEGRKIYGSTHPPAAGERIVMRDLARTLELVAAGGPGTLYGGELGRRVSAHVLERGGRLTLEDLASYRVVRRSPVRVRFRGHDFVSNPPPSSGGVLIAFALCVLERQGPLPPPASARSYALLAEVMRQATLARSGRFSSDLYRGGLAGRLLREDVVRAAAAACASAGPPALGEPAGLPSTTHISVVDAAGNAASLSSSTGAGSGVVVPGTGIHLNNMLGEEDLVGGKPPPEVGRRLTSMMAPSIVLRDGRPRLVVGSAGSVRLRGAILQIVVNVIDRGLAAGEAIAAPRVHLDGEQLHLEGGIPEVVADELDGLGYATVRWQGRNLYFGGASAVALRDDGELEAAGDPRRGGAGIVVA